MNKLYKVTAALLLSLGLLSAQGCVFAAGAAAGAATAEALDENGYEFSSPITKEDDDD